MEWISVFIVGFFFFCLILTPIFLIIAMEFSFGESSFPPLNLYGFERSILSSGFKETQATQACK